MNKKFKDKFESITNSAKETVEKTKSILDQSGATELYNDVSDNMSNHFDMASGTKQFNLIQERLELQTKYNNILAQKLEEALKRIEVLESLKGAA